MMHAAKRRCSAELVPSANRGRCVIAVAGGRQKIAAIRGALRGQFLNVLITDEGTALTLVGSTSR